MRYRPLGAAGVSISALSLTVGDQPAGADRTALIHAALEAGINSFEVQATDPNVVAEVGAALSHLPRELVVVSLRLFPDPESGTFDPDVVLGAVEQAATGSGLGHLNLALFHEPAIDAVTPELLAKLKLARARGHIGKLGVTGEDEATAAHIASGAFSVLATRFNLLSGWPERNRIRTAVDRGMTVFGYGYWGEALRESTPEPVASKPKRLFQFKKRAQDAGTALARSQGYGFLEQAKGWTGEELCLAFALTEPSLATILVEARTPEAITALAATPEREMPTGVSAQIEMARFHAVA